MQKSKQKYHISMEKYNIKKGLIVYTCIVLIFGGCIQAINDKYDADISFQSSCRAGQCGSCGILFNGNGALACQKEIKE